MVTVHGIAWHKRLTDGVGTLITLAKSPFSIVSHGSKGPGILLEKLLGP